MPHAGPLERAHGRALVVYCVLASAVAAIWPLVDPASRSEALGLGLIIGTVGLYVLAIGLLALTGRTRIALVPILGVGTAPTALAIATGAPGIAQAFVGTTLLPVVGYLVDRTFGVLIGGVLATLLAAAALARSLLLETPWPEGAAAVPGTFQTLLTGMVVLTVALLESARQEHRAVAALERARAEARRSRAAMAHTDRLSSLAVLASSVAHGLNNPLTSALDAADHLHGSVRDGRAPDPALVDELRSALGHISTTARALDAFMPSSTLASDQDEEPVDPVDLLPQVAVAAQGIRPAGVRIDLEVPGRLPLVRASRPALAQALLGLVRNALQASSDGDRVVLGADQRPGGALALWVRDDGAGMSRDVQRRAFEPFFTTRSLGDGQGLGLSLARRTAANLGGDIELDSAVGRGTTATLHIPSSALEPRPERRRRSPSPTPVRHRRHRILVVDDEALPLRVVARALGRRHDVVAESDPQAALARLLQGESFDLILTDVMMPHLPGDRLHERLSRDRPDLAARTVFMTGAVLGEAQRGYLGRIGARVLAKPFDGSALLAFVDEALEVGADAATDGPAG